jgi:hypothetical protein
MIQPLQLSAVDCKSKENKTCKMLLEGLRRRHAKRALPRTRTEPQTVSAGFPWVREPVNAARRSIEGDANLTAAAAEHLTGQQSRDRSFQTVASVNQFLTFQRPQTEGSLQNNLSTCFGKGSTTPAGFWYIFVQNVCGSP